MARIHTEKVNGVETHYVKAQDGFRIYIPPFSSTDVGVIDTEKNFDLEKAVAKFPIGLRARAREIAELYNGRQLDSLSVLFYASEEDKKKGTRDNFDAYAGRLENQAEEFRDIHPGLMLARIDVNAFFLRCYADLGVVPVEEAEHAERQVRDYGNGVIVHVSD